LNLTQPDLKESDIVDLGLRYDLTVPLVRFYANNQAKVANPFKAIQNRLCVARGSSPEGALSTVYAM
jgi:histidyl-tRNA synthetase